MSKKGSSLHVGGGRAGVLDAGRATDGFGAPLCEGAKAGASVVGAGGQLAHRMLGCVVDRHETIDATLELFPCGAASPHASMAMSNGSAFKKHLSILVSRVGASGRGPTDFKFSSADLVSLFAKDGGSPVSIPRSIA
ncbi:hypothetical protein [Burkholderia humptydooensis]|uniref:hypothetical protein n=1 Tax=Burkholderia humptydooensis TaxID=430531 RepID=UPI0010FD4A23|nr:hypothetical protein [Burkholderia humptydooensis]